jgi:hypothetical protein
VNVVEARHPGRYRALCLHSPVRPKNCHDRDERNEEEQSWNFHTLPDYLMTAKPHSS